MQIDSGISVHGGVGETLYSVGGKVLKMTSPSIEKFRCRKIVEGVAKGEAMVSKKRISFLGDVDPETGKVVSRDSDVFGKSVRGKVLVFPGPRGSTVGTYVLLRMRKLGTAPIGIINAETDQVVAVGALLAGIPLVDEVEEGFFDAVKTGDIVIVDAVKGYVYIER